MLLEGKSLTPFIRFPKSWHFSQKCQLFFWLAIKQNLTLPHQNNKNKHQYLELSKARSEDKRIINPLKKEKDMKKIYTYTLMAFVAFFAAIFVSCERDPDVDEAITLSGEWTGDLGMYYSDGFYDYDALYSDIRFIPAYNYATYGTGEEVDYFDRRFCPIRYQSFYFEWEIRHGRIYLHFPYNPQLDVAIYDYYLTTSYFTGKLDGDFDTTSFTLRKLYDYYDWNLYGSNYYGYGYWDNYYDPYYYGKSRVNGSAGSVATDSVTTQVSKEAAAVSPENFTFGRRFKN